MISANNNTSKVTLEKIKFHLEQRLSPELLIDTQVGIEQLVDIMVIRAKGFLWGEDVAREEVSYPRDWWQAFKKRWAPSWFLARWPIENTTVVMDAKLIYPKLRISLPKEPHVITISKMNL